MGPDLGFSLFVIMQTYCYISILNGMSFFFFRNLLRFIVSIRYIFADVSNNLDLKWFSTFFRPHLDPNDFI